MIEIGPNLIADTSQYIRRWYRLLAQNRWDEASALIDEPNSYGMVFTPAEIRRVLAANYDFTDADTFTDPDVLPKEGRFSICGYADGSGYSVEYDVPLNGEWSDLTAQFELLVRPGGLAVVLHDLHVL